MSPFTLVYYTFRTAVLGDSGFTRTVVLPSEVTALGWVLHKESLFHNVKFHFVRLRYLKLSVHQHECQMYFL